jgi:signal transduction histidine kinase
MHSRAKLLGGQVIIDSGSGIDQGTSVTISLPHQEALPD